TITISNLEVLQTSGINCFGARNINLQNMIFDHEGPSLSLSQTCICSGISSPSSDRWEIDKLIDYLEFNNCNIAGTLYIQSNAPNTLAITNGSTIGQLGGTPRNTTVSNSTVSNAIFGPAFFGRADTFTAINSTIITADVSAHGFLVPSQYTLIGNGVLRAPK